MELLIGFLHNPKFHIRPMYQVIQDYLFPLSLKAEWGPHVQYIITGQLNQASPRRHRRPLCAAHRDNYVDFYDRLTADI